MQHIQVDQMDAVGVITIDRRHRQNRFDAGTARGFLEASLAMSRDEDVHVVVIRGAGGAFCRGVDLAGTVVSERALVCTEILTPLHEAIATIQKAPKPFVAALEGPAAASGLAIAVACDLVLCSERASLDWADPETGVTGVESSTYFLPRILGLKTAMELVLLNPRLTASEAKSLGLVNAVYPASRMGSEVMSLAVRLAAGPTRAYAAAKALVNQASGIDRLEAHLGRELESLVRRVDGTTLTSAVEVRRGPEGD